MSSYSSYVLNRHSENDERLVAAQNAAEALLGRGNSHNQSFQGTESEASSTRNAPVGSINARAVRIDPFPEEFGSNNYIYLTDDFVSGALQSGGRMSPVRRFFCLLVTFDVLFSGLLWVITVIVTGRDIKSALYQEVVEYTIHSSMFDIVVLAGIRFLTMIVFYAILNINHWGPVALTTSVTSIFLITKVFKYEWTQNGPITFDVTLVLLSFVLAWGETWFLDFRVIPLELRASELTRGRSNVVDCERRPLLFAQHGPMIQRYVFAPTLYEGSVANYYSTRGSPDESDDEDNFVYNSGNVTIPIKYKVKKTYSEKDAELKSIGVDLINICQKMLKRTDWKKFKEEKGILIETLQYNEKQIYKLTTEVDLSPSALVEELFYKAGDFPSWNPTLKECKLIQIIDSHTDITHQMCSKVVTGVSPRDFVNLRHWEVVEDYYILGNVSVEHPQIKEYTRGENGPSCFAISPVPGLENCSRLQWILNTDIKIWIPGAAKTFAKIQMDYVDYLNKRVDELNSS